MSQAVTVPHDPLPLLRGEHPRVIATTEDFARMEERIAAYPRMRAVADAVTATARKLLDEQVVTHDIPDGKRLLEVSRRVVERMYVLCMAYRRTGDAAFRERVWAEMAAVCACPHWNPSHFLDTGEMAHAVAVAYDWLHDAWTDEQRCTMREAIVKHAFTPAIERYDRREWWVVANNNWNVVCNGGLVTAAIALGEETPQLSARVIREAATNVPRCLRHFAPDGGWPEGPGYWGYTLRYLMVMLSSMRAGLGTEFGLGDLPGLANAGMFPVHVRGPVGVFNFADAPESYSKRRGGDGAMIALWLAHRYERTDVISDVDLDHVEHPLALLWWREGDVTEPPRDAYFRGVETVTMRSAWNDPDARFVAAQCGRNIVGHNQADLGSFVLDALGVRWAIDPGTDDYNMPGFFGDKRFDYYRNRAEGHNTLVINPDASAGQNLDAGGTVTHFHPDANHPAAEMDLTEAYPGATRVTRRLEMRDRLMTIVEDRIVMPAATVVWWFMHTRAAVALSDDRRTATLVQMGRTLTATIESAAAVFEVMPAVPLPTSPNPEGQNPNDGSTLINAAPGRGRVKRGDIPRFGEPNPAKAIRKLAIRLDGVIDTTIRVHFTPAI
jgi:PHD/YefM family antitoxin component YafN of YafNO toxin-antitoxin module